MATRTRKTTVKGRTKTVPTRRRKPAAVRRSRKSAGNLANFFVPLFFIGCILVCLGFLAVVGYRTVTASEFFEVKKIYVYGVSRAPRDEIEKIVNAQTEKTGVWNADLSVIKERVEKLQYVKSAAVSRVLPDGVRVNVQERLPQAVVRLSGGDFWVDDEAVVLGVVSKTEDRPPFFLRGWDESKTEKAAKDNQERVKIFKKMLEEWQNFGLSKRIEAVDLEDLRNPEAITRDSGETVKIILAKDGFGKKLQIGLENIAGKGQQVEGIDVSEVQPKFIYRKKTENQELVKQNSNN